MRTTRCDPLARSAFTIPSNGALHIILHVSHFDPAHLCLLTMNGAPFDLERRQRRLLGVSRLVELGEISLCQFCPQFLKLAANTDRCRFDHVCHCSSPPPPRCVRWVPLVVFSLNSILAPLCCVSLVASDVMCAPWPRAFIVPHASPLLAPPPHCRYTFLLL